MQTRIPAWRAAITETMPRGHDAAHAAFVDFIVAVLERADDGSIDEQALIVDAIVLFQLISNACLALAEGLRAGIPETETVRFAGDPDLDRILAGRLSVRARDAFRAVGLPADPHTRSAIEMVRSSIRRADRQESTKRQLRVVE